MLAYSEFHKSFIIDPYYWSIAPFKKIWEMDKQPAKIIAHARVLYIYHCFHPLSPFKEYRKSIKPMSIVNATFPATSPWKEEALKWEPYALTKEASFMPEEQWNAQAWYLQHLHIDPLWTAVDSYSDAMYNLSDIIRNKESTASEIRTASNELDELPKRRLKMEQLAESKQPFTLKVAGDKKIRRSERLPSELKRKANESTEP